MIDRQLFENIKEKYGDVASWAIWSEEEKKPKSNMGDMSIFDLEKNPNLLKRLNNNVIMVGLNFSRPLESTEPFKNFHDTNPSANDFKIRYTFKNTDFYGAYMTDVIKNFEMVDSSDVKKYLKNNPDFIQKNIDILKKEIKEIGASKPMIIAFGVDTYKLLQNYLTEDNYSNLIRVTHYSHRVNKEKYKQTVLRQIDSQLK